jgi:hypothetical protein
MVQQKETRWDLPLLSLVSKDGLLWEANQIIPQSLLEIQEKQIRIC